MLQLFARSLVAACLLCAGMASAQSPVQSCNSTPQPPFCSAVPGDRSQGWLTQNRSEVMARNGIVTTSQPLAAQAGWMVRELGARILGLRLGTVPALRATAAA